MDKIIRLLKEKNHFLEKFYSLNERELKNFAEGKFENLEYFYQTREKILDMINYIDAKLEKANAELGLEPTIASDAKAAVKVEMSIKDKYAEAIMKMDLDILSVIEAAKSSIIKELQDVRKNKKAITGYKVPTQQRRVDEEA